MSDAHGADVGPLDPEFEVDIDASPAHDPLAPTPLPPDEDDDES